MRIILASRSPRRRQLLALLGIHFEVIDSGVEEKTDCTDPGEAARELATLKAQAVSRPENLGESLIIGADTVIDLDGQLIGKPEDKPDAERILKRLCGRQHQVITGLAFFDSKRSQLLVRSVATAVFMADYPPAVLQSYVESGEPMDKAGAYAIQGIGGQLVRSIAGCYSNVVGFPLCEVSRMLKRLGIEFTGSNPVCVLPSGEPCPLLGLDDG